MQFLRFIRCLLPFIILGTVQVTSNGQNTIESSVSHEVKDFPEDWLGTWKGELHIYTKEGLQQSLPMSIINQPTDNAGVYRWAILYGEDETKGLRDYRLIRSEGSDNHFIIDEQNTIRLDAFHFHNVFLCGFEVGGSTLMTSYRLEGDQLVFNIEVLKTEAIRQSGGAVYEGQDIPTVSSFELLAHHEAVLNRVD